MTKHLQIRIVLAAAALCASAPLSGAVAQGTVRIRASRPVVAYGVPDRQCDRALVRDCQADAEVYVKACEPFLGSLECAASALQDLKVCWAQSGCW